MSAAGDYRADVVAKLVAAGLPATVDPAQVPPVVLVGELDMISASGIGAWNASLPVSVVVPPPRSAAAVAALEELREDVYAVLGFTAAGADSIGSTDCPAYTLTYPANVLNPNC